MKRKTYPLISLDTGEIIIECKNDVMTVTPVQAIMIKELDIMKDYIDELPMVLREVIMRRHCIKPYVYDINSYKEIGKQMGMSAYIVKNMYKRALLLLKNMILK